MENVSMPKGMLSIGTHNTLLSHIELLNKLAESSLVKAHVSQVQALKCEIFTEKNMRMEGVRWKGQMRRSNLLILKRTTCIQTHTI